MSGDPVILYDILILRDVLLMFVFLSFGQISI